jgi:hypothetical protein
MEEVEWVDWRKQFVAERFACNQVPRTAEDDDENDLNMTTTDRLWTAVGRISTSFW